jgi:integrase
VSHIREGFRALELVREADARVLVDTQQIAERLRPYTTVKKAFPFDPHLLHLFAGPGMDLTDLKLTVMYCAAARFADLTQVRPRDVDVLPSTVQMTMRATKTDKATSAGRTVEFFLPESACHTLTSHLASLPNDSPVFPASYKVTLKRLQSRAGHQFSLHSLRRGAVQAAMRAGVADRDVMRLTGHQSRRALAEYAETLPTTWRAQSLRAASAILCATLTLSRGEHGPR